MKAILMLLLAAALGLNMMAAQGEVSGKKSEDYEPLYELAENYGFKLGACYSYGQLRDKTYLEFVGRHFNSLTCTNETKAYSLLDQRASVKSEDGMPRMNYASADKMLAWARDNGISVRGHVLVWDAYMTEWFFHEDYNVSRPIADKETMRLRLKSYIEQVIEHFETSFPGVIYCWDVVNEAIGESLMEYDAKDLRRVRTMRDGKRNPFYDYVGEDYVEYSFLCARDAVEKLGADVKLFYNDYNMFFSAKRDAACRLIDSINSYAADENGDFRRLIDGVGMQGYVGGYGTQAGCMANADIASIKNSILMYAGHDVEVQITEMAVRNYDLSKADKHAEFYGNLFKMFRSINQNAEGNPLTAVCIWGVMDCDSLPKTNYSWKMNSPYGGLITEKYEIKTTFDAVYHVLKGE